MTSPHSESHRGRRIIVVAAAIVAGLGLLLAAPNIIVRLGGTGEPGSPSPAASTPSGGTYPWHTGIVSTTFWVGEVFDPNASDGSQVYSTYDSGWMESYGGCDGILTENDCQTEARSAANGFFPTTMTPLENPFYLDLPFDDLNDPKAFASREKVIPWAGDPAYAGSAGNDRMSLMKNRWVRIRANGHTCYGQIQDAGPGQYHDAAYVFGHDDRRPANKKFNGAGMDVSPALNGCLRFTDINGEDDTVDWQFVEFSDVPPGPWTTIVTTSGVR
ncbi:hypothetical protein RCH16_002511 [Cryobacterium sp. MP_M5]|uniref:hypothetical protein n=1 Tax=unclassified Cryobacterium TaxID=2649013 RepID=UPI0018CACB94|nr:MULTISPECIES: hypothetical protein [unclassified Cryobacterium]MBG6059199.1 hypothetical protein [Cryobacterium sp. MP_M3]MEC5177493.1 hypothetical protein [Cryobacterium sp. MP_M5]